MFLLDILCRLLMLSLAVALLAAGMLVGMNEISKRYKMSTDREDDH